MSEEKHFDDLTTEQLRAMAAETDGGRANWHLWTREMLLAFFHNRPGQFVLADQRRSA